jgi:cytochrome c-type biogenesis protein CcmH
MKTTSARTHRREDARRFDPIPAEPSGDAQVWRDQLKEVERELAQGLIDMAQAQARWVAISRCILAAHRMDEPAKPMLSPGRGNLALICVAAIVLGSVGLYALAGYLPAIGAGPPRRMLDPSAEGASAVERLAAVAQPAPEDEAWSQPHANLPPVDDMIQRLAVRLQQNPTDAEGWTTLGWAYLNTGQFAQAAAAYAKAIELMPNSADIRGARLEALVKAADGFVTAEAKAAIAETLKLDPKDPRGRFFEGLAKAQAGDKVSALSDWTDLLKDADPEEPWVPDLRSRIGELRSEMNGDVPPSSSKPPPTVAGEEARASEKGPQADVQAAETMAPGERLAMIRAMVEGLASRLDQSPRDGDGWIKLIRSRMVLGDSDRARQALERGLEAFSDDPQQRGRLLAAAEQMGLSP